MFDNGKRPTWCLGCGHFGVLNSLKAALSSLGLKPENTSIVSGIGCSGRIFQFLSGYNFHSAHGRALTVAQGIKSANKDLCVIAAGGGWGWVGYRSESYPTCNEKKYGHYIPSNVQWGVWTDQLSLIHI